MQNEWGFAGNQAQWSEHSRQERKREQRHQNTREPLPQRSQSIPPCLFATGNPHLFYSWQERESEQSPSIYLETISNESSFEVLRHSCSSVSFFLSPKENKSPEDSVQLGKTCSLSGPFCFPEFKGDKGNTFDIGPNVYRIHHQPFFQLQAIRRMSSTSCI